MAASVRATWTALWAKAKARAAILAAVAVAVAGLLVTLLMKRRRLPLQTERKVHEILATRQQKTEAAKAEAAIRIEAARAREGTLKAQLAEVMNDPDGPQRRRRLIELSQTIDRSSQRGGG